MQEFIRQSYFKSQNDALATLFTVNGSGLVLDHLGYLRGINSESPAADFPEPTPLSWISTWESNPEYQTFRKLAGCANNGFKESVIYFMGCISITPDTVDGIKPWKENIVEMAMVLLHTPTKKFPYSKDELDKFLDDVRDEPTTDHHSYGNDSVTKKWFFDVQWSDCPISVEDEVIEIWGKYDFGNDNYIHQCKLSDSFFNEYPRIYLWMRHKGVMPDEEFIIHWWW